VSTATRAQRQRKQSRGPRPGMVSVDLGSHEAREQVKAALAGRGETFAGWVRRVLREDGVLPDDVTPAAGAA
jgi:hypothetical protein